MSYTKKSIDLVEDVWCYFENNYKGSEITLELVLRELYRRADTRNNLVNAIKYLWSCYEFYDYEYKDYCKNYIYNNYGIKVK